MFATACLACSPAARFAVRRHPNRKRARLTPGRRFGSPFSRRAMSVSADATVTTGRAVWLAEDGRKEAPDGTFSQDFLFDLGVPKFPTNSPAPLREVMFNAGSEAVAVTIDRPLGLVFEEKLDGLYTKIVVEEIVPGGNADKAGVLQVGDVLRVTTAVFLVPGVVDVTAWLNPPKASNCKAFFVCDKQNFDKVMSAIQSHVVPVDTPDGVATMGEVGLVLERRASGR